jgi:hypothetical protein
MSRGEQGYVFESDLPSLSQLSHQNIFEAGMLRQRREIITWLPSKSHRMEGLRDVRRVLRQREAEIFLFEEILRHARTLCGYDNDHPRTDCLWETGGRSNGRPGLEVGLDSLEAADVIGKDTYHIREQKKKTGVENVDYVFLRSCAP